MVSRLENSKTITGLQAIRMFADGISGLPVDDAELNKLFQALPSDDRKAILDEKLAGLPGSPLTDVRLVTDENGGLTIVGYTRVVMHMPESLSQLLSMFGVGFR